MQKIPLAADVSVTASKQPIIPLMSFFYYVTSSYRYVCAAKQGDFPMPPGRSEINQNPLVGGGPSMSFYKQIHTHILYSMYTPSTTPLFLPKNQRCGRWGRRCWSCWWGWRCHSRHCKRPRRRWYIFPGLFRRLAEALPLLREPEFGSLWGPSSQPFRSRHFGMDWRCAAMRLGRTAPFSIPVVPSSSRPAVWPRKATGAPGWVA